MGLLSSIKKAVSNANKKKIANKNAHGSNSNRNTTNMSSPKPKTTLPSGSGKNSSTYRPAAPKQNTSAPSQSAPKTSAPAPSAPKSTVSTTPTVKKTTSNKTWTAPQKAGVSVGGGFSGSTSSSRSSSSSSSSRSSSRRSSGGSSSPRMTTATAAVTGRRSTGGKNRTGVTVAPRATYSGKNRGTTTLKGYENPIKEGAKKLGDKFVKGAKDYIDKSTYNPQDNRNLEAQIRRRNPQLSDAQVKSEMYKNANKVSKEETSQLLNTVMPGGVVMKTSGAVTKAAAPAAKKAVQKGAQEGIQIVDSVIGKTTLKKETSKALEKAKQAAKQVSKKEVTKTAPKTVKEAAKTGVNKVSGAGNDAAVQMEKATKAPTKSKVVDSGTGTPESVYRELGAEKATQKQVAERATQRQAGGKVADTAQKASELRANTRGGTAVRGPKGGNQALARAEGREATALGREGTALGREATATEKTVAENLNKKGFLQKLKESPLKSKIKAGAYLGGGAGLLAVANAGANAPDSEATEMGAQTDEDIINGLWGGGTAAGDYGGGGYSAPQGGGYAAPTRSMGVAPEMSTMPLNSAMPTQLGASASGVDSGYGVGYDSYAAGGGNPYGALSGEGLGQTTMQPQGGATNSVEALYWTVDGEGNLQQNTGYIIGGKTFADPDGTTPVPNGSIVQSTDGSGNPAFWFKDEEGNSSMVDNPFANLGGELPAQEEVPAEEDVVLEQIMESYKPYLDSQYAAIDKQVEDEIMRVREDMAARGVFTADAAISEEQKIRAWGEQAKQQIYGDVLSKAYADTMGLVQQRDELAWQKENAQAQMEQEWQKWLTSMGIEERKLDQNERELLLDQWYKQQQVQLGTDRNQIALINAQRRGSGGGGRGGSSTKDYQKQLADIRDEAMMLADGIRAGDLTKAEAAARLKAYSTGSPSVPQDVVKQLASQMLSLSN